MTNPTDPAPSSPPPPPADDIAAEERADETKTADDAPAPAHLERERDVLTRDAHGHDPRGAETYGPDGERRDVKLGQAPDQVPDPIAGAMRHANERERGS